RSRLCLWDAVGILILCLASAAAALDFKYHHTKELEEFLRGVHAAYPSLTHLHSIGRSHRTCHQGKSSPNTYVSENWKCPEWQFQKEGRLYGA
uniref:Uncharacterized protein n=1 Tax=Geospiza parvula TaxID=87175 RepID=A0A8U8CCJ6_GEOPR